MATVAITGASGFLGSALSRSLRAGGVDVLSIGRAKGSDVTWDPQKGELDGSRLEGVAAVVHLAGENIAQRWTERAKRAIRESRVASTTLLARTLAGMQRKPRVLVSASAAGIYGAHRGGEVLDESASLGSDFLADVARQWEKAAEPAAAAGIRVAYSRSAAVLGEGGGMLRLILPIFKLGAGGKLGSGKQWMSWVSLSDWVRAARYLLDHDLEGAFNVCAPNPVTNETFSEELGRVLKRPTLLSVPEFSIKLVFGEMGEATALGSQRMIPRRLQEAGFSFEFPELDAALRHELRQR